MVKQYHTRLLSVEFLVRIQAEQPLSLAMMNWPFAFRFVGRGPGANEILNAKSESLNEEARKAGVLIGFENRDDLIRLWEFDPLSLRHFNEIGDEPTKVSVNGIVRRRGSKYRRLSCKKDNAGQSPVVGSNKCLNT